jgi:hypothetical protein
MTDDDDYRAERIMARAVAWALSSGTTSGAEGRSDSQLIFCSEPVQPGGAAATSKDKALRKLKDDGQSPPKGSMSSLAATAFLGGRNHRAT